MSVPRCLPCSSAAPKAMRTIYYNTCACRMQRVYIWGMLCTHHMVQHQCSTAAARAEARKKHNKDICYLFCIYMASTNGTQEDKCTLHGPALPMCTWMWVIGLLSCHSFFGNRGQYEVCSLLPGCTSHGASVSTPFFTYSYDPSAIEDFLGQPIESLASLVLRCSPPEPYLCI